MNATTWTVEISLTEGDGEVFARAVLRLGGKVFEGSGTARLDPMDVVRPAPGAAHAAERALVDLVQSISCARLQRFAVGGCGPLIVTNRADMGTDSTRNNGSGATHNGATHNGATRDHDALLAEFSVR